MYMILFQNVTDVAPSNPNSGIDATTVIAICGVIVAVLATVVTIWQGIITRSHNKKSVRPYLGYVTDPREDKFLCTIKNYGLGPAIVKSVTYSIDEKDCKDFNDFLPKLNSKIKSGEFWVTDIGLGTTIGAGHDFLFMQVDINEQMDIAKAKSIFENMNVIIEYESMYEEAFKFGLKPF